MRSFFVITNRAKENAVAVSHRIQTYLTNKGLRCVLDTTDPETLAEGYTDPKLLPADTDCVLVLGGDGTLLQAARDLREDNLPFLGINFGTLGFLSEAPADEVFPALDRMIRDDYLLEERMMIAGEMKRSDVLLDASEALNDIVISRKGSLQILDFTVSINGQLMHRYHADGLIVATPTGSTGYALSAGGPIINPVSRMILLTPICPHSMHNRSILFSPEDEVKIEIDRGHSDREPEIEAIFDGAHRTDMKAGDTLLIREATRRTKVVKLRQESFLTTLQNKLKDD